MGVCNIYLGAVILCTCVLFVFVAANTIIRQIDVIAEKPIELDAMLLYS